MSMFSRFTGWRVDPTEKWEAKGVPVPDFEMDEMRFGGLRFGDAVEKASFLGRPDRLTWNENEEDYCELLYAAGGFQVDFAGGKFAYLAFFIGADELQPEHHKLKYSSPFVACVGGDKVRLSGETDRAFLEATFGEAESVDCDAEETVLFYECGGITMEFEMNGEGLLKRWNLFPEGGRMGKP